MTDEQKPDTSGGATVLRPVFGKRTPAPSDETEKTASDDAPPMDPGAKAKLEAFTDFIERGMVMVTLDARPVGVRVPPNLKGELQLNLNFSHKFFLGDFVYDGRGVRASLSFGGQPFFCDVPWTAVWMMRSMVDGAVVVSPEDVPPEVRAALKAIEAEMQEEPESSPVAEAPDAPDEPSSSSVEAPDVGRSERPTLRLVKDP